MMMGGNPVPPAHLNYLCKRCRKSGHYIQYCPTNNDPEYDYGGSKNSAQAGNDPVPLERVHGIATSVRTKVKDLSGVDVTGKLVSPPPSWCSFTFAHCCLCRR